ncbi:hypothetical protein JNW91_15535 [Micromonospora sp. STR1_7]|uniref:Uncharacterized protein n=1 Tax=Micromonospora parastrephiae TaxID=2806101 RepID=A0ABS1XV87_9ACTN|nr:hypothetical protein [Micromonospora parastrephiae]MBM0233150.1 hypothetical protein [Micromonospora parastrephiae]
MSVGTVDDLREAWLATIAAADRAGAHLHGAGPPGRRLPWQDAVTECWRALSLVYAGLAADRNSPAASVGDLVAGLRVARVDADRAAALAARVRWRLGATEDRRYDATGRDVDPVLAEALVWAALGEGPPVPDDAAAIVARTVLLLGLLEDEGLTDRELDEILVAASVEADRQ